MKKLLASFFLLSSCSFLDPNSRLVVPDMVQRSMSNDVIYGTSPTNWPVTNGFQYSDANVVALVSDSIRAADALRSSLNGETNLEALLQTGIWATIAGLALGHAPIAAAGGIGLASLVAARVFTQGANPQKANALMEFSHRNTDLLSVYYPQLQAETCSNGKISGTVLTSAGTTLLAGYNGSKMVYESVYQGLMPTPAAFQAATAPANGGFFAVPDGGCQQPPPASLVPGTLRLNPMAQDTTTTTTTVRSAGPRKITTIKPDPKTGQYFITVEESK